MKNKSLSKKQFLHQLDQNSLLIIYSNLTTGDTSVYHAAFYKNIKIKMINNFSLPIPGNPLKFLNYFLLKPKNNFFTIN